MMTETISIKVDGVEIASDTDKPKEMIKSADKAVPIYKKIFGHQSLFERLLNWLMRKK